MQHDRKNNDILGKTKTPRNLVFIRNPGILYVCSAIGVTGFEPVSFWHRVLYLCGFVIFVLHFVLYFLFKKIVNGRIDSLSFI